MTASEPGQGGDRPLAERALDLLLYAPAGLLLTAAEDFPQVAAKGRDRVAREVRNARVVGRFAVDFGRRQVVQQLESLAALRQPGEGPESPGQHRSRPVAGEGGPDTSEHAQGRGGVHARPRREPAVDRAIPGYDTLSASQVARRLDGLSPEDLRAVVRHEAAGRGRRTVLTRAEQLLGAASPPDTSATS